MTKRGRELSHKLAMLCRWLAFGFCWRWFGWQPALILCLHQTWIAGRNPLD